MCEDQSLSCLLGLSLLLTSAAVELNQLTALRSHRGSVETCCVRITIAIVNGMSVEHDQLCVSSV